MKLKLSKTYFILFGLILLSFTALSQGVEGKLKEETTKYEQANAEFMMIEAEKYFLLEDYERALSFLDKSVEIDSKNHAAQFKKAEIYLATNDPKKGLEAIRKAINIVQGNKYYYVLGAQLEKANRNISGAANFYQLMVENTSDFNAYLVELAITFQSTDQVKDAIKIFESEDHLNLDQSMKLIEMYVQESKNKNAVSLMEKLLIDYPADDDLKYQYVNLLTTVGQTDKAIATLEAEPNKTAEMRILLSNLYSGSGQANANYDLLIESFNDPNASLTDKTLLLGQLILENDNNIPVQLADSLQTSLEYQYPNEALAIENGSYVYSMLAEITEGEQQALFRLKAINRYKQLKDLKPGDFKVWDKVLSYEYESGDWQALSADADEALMLYPNQAVFYVYLASAKIKLEEPAEAEDLLNQAARMTRSNPLLRSQILGKQAEVAQLKGNSETALALYNQALELEVVHPETNISYAKFKTEVRIPELESQIKAAEDKKTATENTAETDENIEQVTSQSVPSELQKVKTQASTYFEKEDFSNALVLMLAHIHEFEDLNDGEALELYGDIFAKVKLAEIAVKYWKLAKIAGGASDKIDQKIATGKNN